MADFAIRRTSRPVPQDERARLLERPGFGAAFTDHMVTLRWNADRGWHDGRVEPYGPFSLPPSTSVFHYGQAVFEGMKAYRQHGGSVALFRPEANAERFNRSAARLEMPPVPVDVFLRAVELLVQEDRDWVPANEGDSLYLRPFMVATQPGLGFTHPSSEYLFCVIASPAAPYFGPAGPRALRVWLCKEYSRAAPGGTGAAKTPGNYAAAFIGSRQATEHGCDQVVWLDATEHAWVEEMGGMNVFFVLSGEHPRLVTPELTGTLLPGVTRDSLLALAPTLGMEVSQERVSVARWREGCATGEIVETFACGTAAVLAPVGSVHGTDAEWTVGDGTPGPVTRLLREELLGIQHGNRPDPFAWVHKVC